METLAWIFKIFLVLLGIASRILVFIVLPILLLIWVWQQLFGDA